MKKRQRAAVVELLRCAAYLCTRGYVSSWPGSEGDIGCVSIASGALDMPMRVRNLALQAQRDVDDTPWVNAEDRRVRLLEAAQRVEDGEWP